MASSMSLPGVRMMTDSGSPSRRSWSGSSGAISSAVVDQRPPSNRSIETARDASRGMEPMLSAERRDEGVVLRARVEIDELVLRDVRLREVSLADRHDVERLHHVGHAPAAAI